MAKKAETEGDEGPKQSTLAVDREIANRIRAVASEVGLTTLDVTNQLLRVALDSHEISFEVRTIKLNPKTGRRK